MSFYYIIGDINDKESTFLLFEVQSNSDCDFFIKSFKYETKEFMNVVSLILRFVIDINDKDIEAKFCCLSITSNKEKSDFAKEEDIKNSLGFEYVILTNDFNACVYGIFSLSQKHILQIQTNSINIDKKNKIIFRVENGLEVAVIKVKDNDFSVVNVDWDYKRFEPRNDSESELLSFIKSGYANVDMDIIFSKSGLDIIYKFFCQKYAPLENKSVTLKIKKSDDKRKIIINLAKCRKDIICVFTLRLFFKCYGHVVENLVVENNTDGGVYLVGAYYSAYDPSLLPFLMDDFLTSFCSNKVENLITEIPVSIIMNQEYAIIYGMKCLAWNYIHEMGVSSPVALQLMSSGKVNKKVIVQY